MIGKYKAHSIIYIHNKKATDSVAFLIKISSEDLFDLKIVFAKEVEVRIHIHPS